MANFFTRLFGKNQKQASGNGAEQVIIETLDGVLDTGGFDLDFDVESTEEGFFINISGGDSDLVTSKEGLLLDSFQVFIKRMLQNKFPDTRIEVQVDCDGFLDKSSQELRDLADKLKAHVLEKGGASYVRALPPRERKIVHRHLASDERVKSQSIGDGFCKKIKISLTADNSSNRRQEREQEGSY